MTLQFQPQINNQPTNFIDKIWQSLLRDNIEMNFVEFNTKFKEMLPVIGETKVGSFPQKKHTIRTDKNNRWVKGSNIHFKTWSGRPYHSKNINFAPIIKVVSTQKIEILYKDIDGFKLEVATVYVDGVWLPGDEVETLAINDGFANIADFFAYFNQSFTGKIIHWTTLKY